MIETAIEFLADSLKNALELDENVISVDTLQVLQDREADGIVVSLLNVEEESTLKNSPHHFVQGKTVDDKILYRQAPPLSLNLRIVFVFDFDDYGTTLQRLSEAANFFHKKKWFNPGIDSETTLPEPIGKLILDLETLTLEQLNHVWSISGGIHYPALFYRVRLLQLEQDEPAEGTAIKNIETTHENFSTPEEMKKHLKEKLENGV